LDCTLESPPECGVPRNAAFELRFNRYLRPDTAVRQSLRVYLAGAPNTQLFLIPTYDVVERVVSYRFDGQLEAGLLYTVELFDPERDELGFGFRAFDGAPLRQQPGLPLVFQFRAARADPGPGPEPQPEPDCADALAAFSTARGGCSAAGCHAADRPLDLASAAAIAAGAFNRPARETELANRVDYPLLNPERFGVSLPLILPGEAAWSYLLYKLLVNPANFADGDCASRYRVAFGSDCLYSPAEAERLANWFVLGTAMPPPGFEAPDFGLDELRLLERWIDAGAELAACR
jgi:hypothetical protein